MLCLVFKVVPNDVILVGAQRRLGSILWRGVESVLDSLR